MNPLHRTQQTILVSSMPTTISRVYQWMTVGILLTAIVSLALGQTSTLALTIAKNPFIFYGAMIAQLVLVFGLSASISRLSSVVALGLFLLYSALNGVTFSVLFLVYTASSIQSAFFTTSIGFAGLSAYGYMTKKDLGFIGTFAIMGLWGLFGMTILSFFVPSIMGGTMGLIYSCVGLLVFSGLTAYDTQKIKEMIFAATTEEDQKKVAILGALTLYLDFINLFLIILRFVGNGGDRRD